MTSNCAGQAKKCGALLLFLTIPIGSLPPYALLKYFYPLGTWANIVPTTTFSVLFFLLSNVTHIEMLVSWFLQSSFNAVQFSSQRKLCLGRVSSHIFITFWTCFHERVYKYFPKYLPSLREGLTQQVDKLDKESWCRVLRTELHPIRTQVRDGASPPLCYR